MKIVAVLTIFLFNCICVENRALPMNSANVVNNKETTISSLNHNKITLGFDNNRQNELVEQIDNYDFPAFEESAKKPCTIIVVSSAQSPNTQNLVRKYTYDADGVLIPSSVKYFIKMSTQDKNSGPVLIPLSDKAFSPLGGFIRYYKEVPPIPHTNW